MIMSDLLTRLCGICAVFAWRFPLVDRSRYGCVW